MKTNSTKGLFLVVVVLFASSCFKDGVLNLTNGLAFNVNAKLLPAPITVTFVNADPGVGNIPEDIYLDFFGEGALKLFTPTGGSNLVVVEGMVHIGVKDEVKPSANSPLRFGMEVEAPGFYPATYFVSLYNKDIPQYVTVYLVQKGNTPSGVSDKKEIHQVPSTGFTSSQNLETPLINGKKEKAKLSIQPGTKLLTINDALVTGNVQVSLVHYDNRSSVSLRSISGITESIPATGLAGEDLGNISFYSAGLYMLQLYAGSVNADRFSKPVQINLTLNPQTYNPETGQYVKAGDVIGLWRFDERENRWKGMGQAEVKEEFGKLTLSFEQTYAGVCMAAQAANLCEEGATLRIKSGIPEGACARSFYTTLVDINTGKPLSTKWSDNYLPMDNNSRISLTNIPENAIAKLQVWEGVKGCEGQLLAESQPFSACDADEFQLDLSELNTQGWLPLSMSLTGYCTVNGVEVEIPPTSSITYRPAGCGVYGLLGELEEGQGCIATLKKGAVYDFKTRLGTEVFEFMQIPIEDGEIHYTLANGETAIIRVETDPGGAKLSIEGLPLPEDICELGGE